jgi:hypothetical protein
VAGTLTVATKELKDPTMNPHKPIIFPKGCSGITKLGLKQMFLFIYSSGFSTSAMG